MPMRLPGRNVRDRRARWLGLVAAVAREGHGRPAATAAVTGNLKLRRSRVLVPLINSYYARLLAAKRMRRETAKKPPIAHYPAPHALIDLWQKNDGNPQDVQRGEIASFARLLGPATCRNVVRVF